AYAHKVRGVLHRDLKPGNILVGERDEVQVLDWGLGKVVHGAGADLTEQAGRASPQAPDSYGPHFSTQFGTRIGTPSYIPPEEARGEVGSFDERSDVSGLGAILCEILTGKPPYLGAKQEVEELASSAESSLGPVHARLDACGADEELIALARRCLAANPTNRL